MQIFCLSLPMFSCDRRAGGVKAFYRGLAVNAAKTTPGAAIQFAAYDTLKGFFAGGQNF